MSTPEYTPKRYICNICNIIYASRQSLWNHTNKFHTIINVDDKSQDKSRVNNDKSNDKPRDKPVVNIGKNCDMMKKNNITHDELHCDSIDTKYKCSKCNCAFVHYQSRWKHEKKCNENIDNKLKEENIKLKNELKKKDDEIKIQLDKFKNEILQIMNKQCKIHPKTLQKINNTLNNNCNNTNNIIKIVQLGNENL